MAMLEKQRERGRTLRGLREDSEDSEAAAVQGITTELRRVARVQPEDQL